MTIANRKLSSRRFECLCRHLHSNSQYTTNTALTNCVSNRSSKKPINRIWTLKEIKNNREQGIFCLVIRNKVYDVTEYLDEHPGGREIIEDLEINDLETANAEFDLAEHSEVSFLNRC